MNTNHEKTVLVREVLEFDLGVRVYPPTATGGYWRVRWEERHRQRDTTARTRTDAIAKASEVVERLARDTPTELGRARGAALVIHYLDPSRRPPRVEQWSVRHRDEQARYCERYILPVIGEVPCRRLTRTDIQAILDQAPTVSVAQHLRRCLTGLVAAGLEAGHLLVRQDLLRGVRWRNGTLPPKAADRGVTRSEIPTVDAVHALAAATAQQTGMWWRELQILLVAYSGLRWGEHVALTATQIDLDRRRVDVDRQVVETRNTLQETLPKNRRRRTTMYPAVSPGGVDLDALTRRRIDELPDDGLLFPAPLGGWARRSNYGRNTWDPAATSVNWPRGGRAWAWTFHSLRHVYATWALHEARIPIGDLSRLMGHSSTRVTQDVYVHVRDDMFVRFYDATV